MIDLNTVIPAGSGLQLTNAFNINDRGEILAKSIPEGVTPVDDEDLGHVVLLVPCEEDRGDCVNLVAAGAESKRPLSTFTQTHVRKSDSMREGMRGWRERFATYRKATIGSER
jgi:hypothetical protein